VNSQRAARPDHRPDQRSERECPRKRARSRSKKRIKQYSDAFFKYLAVGVDELSPEERSILRKGYSPSTKKGEIEQRAQTITTTGGGYTESRRASWPSSKRAQLYYADILASLAC
jgi:hypothetical protein